VFYWNDETEYLYRDLYTYDGDLLVHRVGPPPRPAVKHPNAVDPEGGNVYLYGASGLIQDLGNSYEFDPNGSTIGRIGDQGLRAEDPHLYDAYGEPVWYYSAEPGLGLRPDYNGQVFLYKGQYGCVTDTDTGLVYCHHRYYDPMACRWISRDPAGLEGGINTYQYCNGDPIDAADPSGTSPISLPILVQNELARERAEQVIAAIGKGTLFVAGGALCLAAADEALDVAALYAAGQEAREIAQGVRAINDIRTVANYYHGDLVRSPLWQTGTRRRHHIFPQQYRILFEEQWGIQIDDYVYEMPGWLHDAIHRGEGQGRGGWWNNQWRGFIELHKGVKPPIPEILKFGSHLMHEIGVPRLDLKP
jgi:RHS repeat-associated protein